MRNTRPATVTSVSSLGVDGLRDGVAGRLADGIGVDSVVLQRLELGHPHAHLFGQPWPASASWQIGLQVRSRSGALPSWCSKPVATRFSGAEM